MNSHVEPIGRNTYLHLKGHFGEWTRFQRLWFNGIFFLGNQQLDARQAEQLIGESIDRGEIDVLLRRLNGFFSFIFQTEDSLYLAADRIRSRPLFYWANDSQLRVSDCARWLRSQVPDARPSPAAAEEYLRAGYVTGEETLFSGIRQVQVAEVLKFSPHGLCDRIGYYHFMPENTDPTGDALDCWITRIDQALWNCIDRTIEMADGRQIVIPLSGGYDSRAIAAYLKQSGYAPLMTFTFGKRTSPEVIISRRVARDLGLEWHFVPYTRSTWGQVKTSPWFKDYCLLINSLVSVPNVQVLPAIKQLIQQGLVSPDAIVIPGHTGDFLAGGQMPGEALRDGFVFSRPAAVSQVLKRHFGHRQRRPVSKELIKKIELQISRLWENCPQDWSDRRRFLAVVDAWNYRERQAKFIANSNRYYDYFGLGWWMPFWDWEYVCAWQQAPVELRKNEKLWVELIDQKMKGLVGEHAVYGHASKSNSRLTRSFHRTFDYFTDPNHLFRLVPFHRWMLSKARMSKKTSSVFEYLSEQTLDWVISSD